jgi:hypothetical protein
MNIEDADKKVKQVDSLLTSITKLFKTHWVILIVLALGVFIYFSYLAPDNEASTRFLSPTENVIHEKVIVDTVYESNKTHVDSTSSDSTVTQ